MAFWFFSAAFLFPRSPRKSIYGGNGFPLSSKAFQFSSTAFRFSSTAFRFSSTAFLFPRNPRKSIYGGKYTKDHHSSFVFPATRSPSFVITTRSPSFVIATRSPSFVIATMRVSHPTENVFKSRLHGHNLFTVFLKCVMDVGRRGNLAISKLLA